MTLEQLAAGFGFMLVLALAVAVLARSVVDHKDAILDALLGPDA